MCKALYLSIDRGFYKEYLKLRLTPRAGEAT